MDKNYNTINTFYNYLYSNPFDIKRNEEKDNEKNKKDEQKEDKTLSLLYRYYDSGYNIFKTKLLSSIEKQEIEPKPLTEYEQAELAEQKAKEKEASLKQAGINIPKKTYKSVWGYATDILSVLDILRYPITNTIYHISKGVKEHENALKTATDVLKGIWKGLLLLEKRDSKDVMDYLFNKDKTYSKLKDWQKTVIGIALDILTDPSTYLTFGASSVLKKGTTNLTPDVLKIINSTKNVFEEGVEGVIKESLKAKALKKGVSPEVVDAMGRTGKEYAQRVIFNINNMLKKQMDELKDVPIKIPDEDLKMLEGETFEQIRNLYENLLKRGKQVSKKTLERYMKEKAGSINSIKKYLGNWFDKKLTSLLSKHISTNVDLFGEFLNKLKTSFNVTGNNYDEIIENIRKVITYRDYGLNFAGKKIIDMPLGKTAFIGDVLGSIGKVFGKEEEARSLATPIKSLSLYATQYPSKFVSKLYRIGSEFVSDIKTAFDTTAKWDKTFKFLHRDELLEFSKAVVRKDGVLKHFNVVKKNIDDFIKVKNIKHITEDTYNDILDDLIFIKEAGIDKAVNSSAQEIKEIANDFISLRIKDIKKFAHQSGNTAIINNIDLIKKGFFDEFARLFDDYSKNAEYYEKIWNELHTNLDTMWGELLKRGLAKADEYLVNYFPRFIRPKGQKSYVLAKDFSDTANIFLRRLIDIKKIGEELNIDYLTPTESLAKYYDKAIKKIQVHDTIQRIIEKVGHKIKGAGKDVGAKTLLKVDVGDKILEVPIKEFNNGFVQCPVGGFEDWQVPKEVAETLLKVSTIILEEDIGTKLFKYFHKLQDVWKKMVTVFNFPFFQHRNQISNTWTFLLKDGVSKESIQSIKDAIKLSKGLISEKNLDKTVDGILDIIDKTEDVDKVIKTTKSAKIGDVLDALKKLGVIKGDFSASMVEQVGNQLKFAYKKGAIKKFEEFASKYGAFWEDITRTASFFSDLRKGKTIREALDNVDKWFINYVDLTRFEKNIMKTIFPFYTWIRKNLANQLTAMAENPFKYKLLTTKMMEALNGLSPEEEKYLPEYMKTAKWINPFGIRWGDEKNKRILMMNLNLPFQDLSKITSRGGIGEALVSSLSPLVKTGVELIANRNLYNKQPIEKFEGELKELPAVVQSFFLVLPAGIKKKLGLKVDKEGKVLAPTRIVYALENLIPVSRLSPIESGVEFATGAEYQKERAPFKFLKTLTGVSLTPLNVNYYRRRNMEDLLYKLKRLQSKQPTTP